MTAFILPNGKQAYVTPAGLPAVGWKLYTTNSGTAVNRTTWQDAGQVTPNANPIVLDARGEAVIFWSGNYRVRLEDNLGNTIWSVDGVSDELSQLSSTTSGSQGAGLVGFNPALAYTAGSVGAYLNNFYDRTAGEIAAGVTPTNYFWPPGWVFRYATNSLPGTTDLATAFQNAIDSADSTYPVVYFTGDCAISRPLLIRSTTTQNITLKGTGRVSTILRPLTVTGSIATAPQNVNCMIFNQHNNGHLRLEGFRFLSATTPGYTGVALYCKEGGGGDASGQAMFSSEFRDIWLALQSTNTGGFQGGFSNLIVDGLVAESVKTGVFMLEGAGNSDHHHTNIVLNNSFDSYLYAAADTVTKAMIRVDGLHAYQHNRGPLFEMKNVVDLKISDVTLEVSAGHLGTESLGKFTDCTDVIYSDSVATIANGTARVANGLEFIGACTGEVIGVRVNATVGVRISGAGTMDMTISASDFTGCQYAYQHLSGNTAGKMRIFSSRFNNAEYCILHSAGAPTYPIEAYESEFMNAGFSGIATGRNVSLGFTGAAHRFVRCKIGHDDVNATAAYRFDCTGTNTIEVIDPNLIGTPPTGLETGATLPTWDGVNSSMPGFTARANINLGGTENLGTKTCQWSKKNKRVDFSIRITVTTIGTGSVRDISGLPFTSDATHYGSAYCGFFSGAATAIIWPTGFVAPGTTQLQLRDTKAAVNGTVNDPIFQNATDIVLVGSYPAP